MRPGVLWNDEQFVRFLARAITESALDEITEEQAGRLRLEAAPYVDRMRQLLGFRISQGLQRNWSQRRR